MLSAIARPVPIDCRVHHGIDPFDQLSRRLGIAQLADFERVYVWFDRDGAGLTGERKLVEGLHKRTEVYVVTPDRGKDMGDTNLDGIALKLHDAVPASLRLGEYDAWRYSRG